MILKRYRIPVDEKNIGVFKTRLKDLKDYKKTCQFKEHPFINLLINLNYIIIDDYENGRSTDFIMM